MSGGRSGNEKIQEYYNFITEMIKKENEIKPYADVPEEERRLLISVKDANQRGNNTAVNYNIEELSSLTTVRNRIYQRSQRINRWSLPLAIFGLIVSIIFGIMNITNRINYDRIESILDNSPQTQVEGLTKKHNLMTKC